MDRRRPNHEVELPDDPTTRELAVIRAQRLSRPVRRAARKIDDYLDIGIYLLMIGIGFALIVWVLNS